VISVAVAFNCLKIPHKIFYFTGRFSVADLMIDIIVT